MKSLITITTALLLGTTATLQAQTANQAPRQQNPGAPLLTPLPGTERVPGVIMRDTTGMGVREPEVEFLFRPGMRDPQRNDLTVSPFGPMNNID